MHSKSISLPFLGTNKKARSISIGWIALGCAVLAGSTSVTFAKELGAVFSPMSLLVLSESIVLLFTVLSFGFLTLTGWMPCGQCVIWFLLSMVKYSKFKPLFFAPITGASTSVW